MLILMPPSDKSLEDVREQQESSLNADVRVVEDALKNPHLWMGSDLALRALTRIRNRLVLEGALAAPQEPKEAE